MSKLAIDILWYLRENYEWAEVNWEEVIGWFDDEYWAKQGFDICDDEDTDLGDAIIEAFDELIYEGWLKETWQPGTYYFDGTMKVSFSRLMDTMQLFVSTMDDCGNCPLCKECAWLEREKSETCGDFIIEHYLKAESGEN